MSEIPERITIECSLEILLCSLCKAYLSCAPILMLPNGNNICGNCSIAGEGQTYRNLALEAILTNTVFSCQYKKNGCQERPVFGHVEEHEAKCDYRTIACPCRADENCIWEGSANGVLDHFTNTHPEYVGENAEFKIEVDQDVKGLRIVHVNNVTFALMYEYTANSSNLQYDVKYFAYNVQEACYKLKLINDADHDYCLSVKGGDCLPYNVNNMQKTKLVLNNSLTSLNNPLLIKIEIDLFVNVSKTNVIFDKELIEELRCNQCEGYLIPPLFDTGDGVVCIICSKIKVDCKPLKDDELKERVANAHYPCYWLGCNMITGAACFQGHIEACSFRVYECIDEACNESFKREQVAHLEGHGYEYFVDWFQYKLIFKRDTAVKHIATFENNGIISVQYGTRYETEVEKRTHEMKLAAFGTDVNNLALKVQFAHNHCKLKSRLYSLPFTSADWYFFMEHLPTCFKQDEELTVMLKVGSRE